MATIERLEVEFKHGLNILTGETGAGKSILIDALDLLVGGRKGTDIIRTGERVAVIEGVFGWQGTSVAALKQNLDEDGIQVSGDADLYIRREFQAGGRSRTFLDDQMVTLGTIKKLRPQILEIHGQGGQHDLTGAKTHAELLDAFAGNTPLRGQVKAAFTRLREAENELRNLKGQLVERVGRAELLRYQVSEIRRIAPRPGEDEVLRDERRLLTNTEQAVMLSNAVYHDLYESERSVVENLGLVRRRLQQLASLDARLTSLPETIEGALLSITDVVETLRGYEEKLNFSDKRLKEVESRLEELETLKRKYGCELNAFDRVVEDIEADLRYWEEIETQEARLKNEIERAKTEYTPLAVLLSERRRAAALSLERMMVEGLRHVGLDQSRFTVEIGSAPVGGGEQTEGPEAFSPGQSRPEGMTSSSPFFSAHGADRVEFLFSANPGEHAQSLGAVASGGELSRLMLTLIGTIIESPGGDEDSSSETVVFDEIDVGIGGRAAEAVGQRLHSLAAKRQVICVTHQPQIARFADHHFALKKSVEKGRTATKIQELSFDERIGELARMVGGDEDADVARETARWMLGDGEKKRNQTRARKTILKKA